MFAGGLCCRHRSDLVECGAQEEEALRSGNGKVQWMVRSSRMDLAFRLAESQTRAIDDDLKVQDLLDFNKMVADAKTQKVKLTFHKID